MIWLLIAIGSYFLFAFSSLADRYLLAGPLPHPRAFAFYTGITGGLAVVLIPFGVRIPETPIVFLALATGVVSVLALYASFRAVYHSGVSRIVPMVGALFPMFTLALTWVAFPNDFSFNGATAAALLMFIIGTVLMSLRGSLREFKPSLFDISNSLLVAFLFSLAFIMTKSVYEAEPFISGFAWMRWGGFLTSLSFLIFPVTRGVVFNSEGNPVSKPKIYMPFLLGKGAGSVAFLMQQAAISLVRPSQLAFISALQGVQYLFLLLFVGILAAKRPNLLKEEFSGINAVWRVSGAAFIAIGFVLFIL